jgi:hypothetical protein
MTEISDFIGVGLNGKRTAPTTANGRLLTRKERADVMRGYRKENPWYWRKMVSAGTYNRPVNGMACFVAWLLDEREKKKGSRQ